MVQVRSKSMPTLQTVLYSIADTSSLRAPKPAQVKFARVKNIRAQDKMVSINFYSIFCKTTSKKKKGVRESFKGSIPVVNMWAMVTLFFGQQWCPSVKLYCNVTSFYIAMWPYMFILSSTHLLLTCFKSVLKK
jgi:hypothetical protein